MDEHQMRKSLRLYTLIGLLVWLLLIGSWVVTGIWQTWPWSTVILGGIVIGGLGLLGLTFQVDNVLRHQIEQLRAWLMEASGPATGEGAPPPRVYEELLPLLAAGDHLRHTLRSLATEVLRHQQRLETFTQTLTQFGEGWTLEHDLELFLERILLEAKQLCRADAGTLYLRKDETTLAFAIVRNDTLGLSYGGSSGVPAPYAPLRLRPGPNDRPGYGRHIAAQVALSGQISNIPRHDTVSFIAGNYIVNSLLTIPLKDSQGRVLGVLQLINAQDPLTGARVPFDEHMEQMVTSFAVLAAAALETWPQRKAHA